MRPCPLSLVLLAPLLVTPAAAPPLMAQTLAALPAAAAAPPPQHRCTATGETAARLPALSGKHRPRRGPTLNRDVRVNDDLARFSRAF